MRALHDVTEGGLATALRELAAATGRGVVVQRERIPVSPETRRLCDLLGADPLGLIGSGSLLVCCRPGESAALLAALRAAGIAAAVIGSLGERGAGVTARERGRPAPWPPSPPTRRRGCCRDAPGSGKKTEDRRAEAPRARLGGRDADRTAVSTAP